KLSKSKKFNYSANGVKNRLIREYMGGKLFGGADSNLRNAIAHFSYVLDGEGVHYKTEGRNETVLSLYDFFNERNKRLNISLNAVWIYLTMIELGGESLLPFEEIKKTVFPKLS
ncbi:TPA: hypothetical protein HA318_03155, partial [Candidatus Micrarchaeota archaeon]|nr:hypothetical protein [Candidatus Micrarchaeota archaeon]